MIQEQSHIATFKNSYWFEEKIVILRQKIAREDQKRPKKLVNI